MNTHKAILCVGIPTLEQIGKFGLGFNDTLMFFETCALLQHTLAGIWEIRHTGETHKLQDDISWSNAGELLRIDLAKKNPSNIAQLRLHYQYVESNDSKTVIDRSVISFDVTSYSSPGYPAKFLIGAKKVGDKFELTYTFL